MWLDNFSLKQIIEFCMLYVMRHGKTDWNLLYKLQGGVDIPLNDMGRKMAAEAAEEYKNVHFDICYSSPLIRAHETAKIFLSNRNIPIITDQRIKEMSFGIYEGAEHVFDHPEWPVYQLFKNPELYNPPQGAESFEDLFKRVGDFLNSVIKKELEEKKDILIVAHGALNSAIITMVKKLALKDFWSFGIPNCKLIPLGDSI